MRQDQEYKNKIVSALAEGYSVKWIAAKVVKKPRKTLESHIDFMKKEYACDSLAHLVSTYLRLKHIK